MPNNNEGPQVIIAKPRFPLPSKIPLIFGGAVLVFIIGFIFFQKFYPQPVPISPPSPSAEPKIAIPCPTDAIFCQNAKPIVKDGRYLGLGTNV